MAISPALNPELIVGKNTGSVGLAQKFITGGSLLGSSVVSSAANKIVGFQRNAAVRPNVPDVRSIIDLLSSSIVNNVDNSINRVITNVNDNTDRKIQNINKDFITTVNNIQNSVNKISLFRNNISQQENKIDQIFKTIEINKNQITNYIDKTKLENKQEIINEVTNIFDTRKVELIRDFQQNIIQSKNDLIERITSETEKIKQEIKNYTENINQITESKIINEITNKIDANKTELINYIQNNINNEDIIRTTETRITNRIQQVENEIVKVRSEKLQSSTIQPNIGVVENEIQNTIRNVIENTRSTIENIQRQVSETLKTTIQNFTKRYDQKVKEVDDAKPVGILQRFISAYQSAIGFFKFFTDKTNLKRLRKGIESLKNSFSETYEVAKLTRQTIVKIIKQLSNLPKVSPSGGGGINLDVDIPGNPLRRAARPVSRRMGFGRMLGYGAMGMGATAAGGAVVNALSGTEDIASSIGQQPEMSGSLIDKFSSIVDRFTKAIQSLSGFSKNQKRSGSSGSSSSSPSRSSSSPSSSGPAPGSPTTGPSQYTPGTIPKEVSSDVSFTKGVTELAKKYNVPEDYLYAVMGFETGGTFSPSEKNKAGSGATGLIQFMPSTAKGLGTSTEELSKMSRTEQLKYVDRYFSGTLNKGASLSDVYMSVLLPAAVGKPDSTVLFGPGGIIPEGYSQNSGLDSNGDGKVTKAEATKAVEKYLPKGSASVKPGMGGPDLPDFMLPPQNQYRNLIPNISQPPPASATTQTQTEVAVIPVSSGDSGGQQGSGIIPPAQQPGKQAEVGFFSPTNPDNFLVLYSRMIYNIVDG